MLIAINLHASVGIARYPLVAGFAVFALHRRPRHAMGGDFARGPARRVFDPGVVEGTEVDFLRVPRQMCLDRGRQVFDGCVGQAATSRVLRQTRYMRQILPQRLAPAPTPAIDPEQARANPRC